MRTKKTKIYLAGPWFTDRSKVLLEIAKDMLRTENNLSCYFPDENNFDTPYDTFKSNIKEIRECDYVIALIDEKDVGTAWELGMAYQLKKKIVLLGSHENVFKSKTNLMLAYNGTCVTMSKFGKFLKDMDNFVDIVHVVRNWDNIE